ncbi:hypothetical protein BBP40_001259 [Aspergillus hancockii]|nr:hypothetical protein BBP40_001259 [Aspergillus hancockii]
MVYQSPLQGTHQNQTHTPSHTPTPPTSAPTPPNPKSTPKSSNKPKVSYTANVTG